MKPVIYKYILRFTLLILLIFVRKYVGNNEAAFGQAFDIVHSTVKFFLFLTGVNIVTAVLIMVYRLRKKLAYKYTDNVISGINNVYYIIVTFGVVMMLLGFWGIDGGKLLTSISIVAAALAIISKDYVSGIISGIIISFSNDISIDDYVKIGDHKGKIMDINLTKVSLLNEDDDIIFIPNDKVYMAEIINYTKRQIKKVSIDFELDLKYLKSVENLEYTLKESLVEYMHLIEPNTISLKIVDIHKEFLVLKFQYKLIEVNRDIEKVIRKKTVRKIANLLSQAPTS